MKLRSKIKEFFPEHLIKLLGSVCDTRRINSAHKKMKLIQQLLKKYEIPFQPLGGATNRIALMINGYTVKFALDRQGYKDNLMEYALSRELQPYVTKTYETNGYIVIAECVKMMSLSEWHLQKQDILKILEILSSDYLLGDVGYIKKNFTNWGIRDDGSLVILDYAYCHRATENLFTCEVCGSGILRYDSSFTYLRCSNATVCDAKYNYTERKLIQGNQVDADLIQEAKDDSLMIPKGQTFIEVKDDDGKLIDGNVRIIDTLPEYYDHLERKELMFTLNETEQQELLDLEIERLTATEKRKKEIDKELAKFMKAKNEEVQETTGVVERIDWDEIERQIMEEEEEHYSEEPDMCDADYAMSTDDLLEELQRKREEPEHLTVPMEEMIPEETQTVIEEIPPEEKVPEAQATEPPEEIVDVEATEVPVSNDNNVEGEGVFVNGESMEVYS